MAGENELQTVRDEFAKLGSFNQHGKFIQNPDVENLTLSLQTLITNLKSALAAGNINAHVLLVIVSDVLSEQFPGEVKQAFANPEDCNAIVFDTNSTTFNPRVVASLGEAAAKIEQEQKRLTSELSIPENRAARAALKAAKSTLINHFNHLTDVYNNPILAANFYFKYRAEQSKSESLKQDKDYQERKSTWQTVLESLANGEIKDQAIIDELLQPAITAYKATLDLKHRFADILQGMVRVLQSKDGRQRLQRAIAFTQYLETVLCDSWSKPLPGLTPEITADFCLHGLAQQIRARNLKINKDNFLNYEQLYDDLLKFREELLLPLQEGYRGYFIIKDLGQLDRLKQSPMLSSQLKLAIIYEKGYQHQKVKIGPNPHAAYRVLDTIKKTWFPMLDQEVPVWLNSWLGRLLLWDLDKREDGEALLNSCIKDENPDPNALYDLARINLANSVFLSLNPDLWKSSRELAKQYLCSAAERGHPKAIALLLEHQLLTSTDEILQYLRLATVFGHHFSQLVNHGPIFLKFAKKALDNGSADDKTTAVSNLWPLINAGSLRAQKLASDLDDRLKNLKALGNSPNAADTRKQFTDAIEQGWAFDRGSHLQPLKECLSAIYSSNVFLRTIAKVNEHVMLEIKQDWQKIYQQFQALFLPDPVELSHFDAFKLEIKKRTRTYGASESTVSYVKLLNKLLEFLETQEKLSELHQQWQLADSLQQLWSNTKLVTNSRDFIDASLKGFRIQQEVLLVEDWWKSLEFTEENYSYNDFKLKLQFTLGKISPQANGLPPINEPQEYLRRLAKGTTFVELWELIHIYLRGYSYYLKGSLTQAPPDWPKARDRLEQLRELIPQDVVKSATLENLEELINELIKITKDEMSVNLAISVAYTNKWPEPKEEQTVSQQISFLCETIQACTAKIRKIENGRNLLAIHKMYYLGEDVWTLKWLGARAKIKLQRHLATNSVLQLRLLKYQQRAIPKAADILKDSHYQQLNLAFKKFSKLLESATADNKQDLEQHVTQTCLQSVEPFLKHWQKFSELLQTENGLRLLLAMNDASNILLESMVKDVEIIEPLVDPIIEKNHNQDIEHVQVVAQNTLPSIRRFATPLLYIKQDGTEAVTEKHLLYMGMALEDLDSITMMENGERDLSNLFHRIKSILTIYCHFLPWLKTQLQDYEDLDANEAGFNTMKSKLNELLDCFSVLANFTGKAPEKMDLALKQAYKDFLKGIVFYVDLLLPVPENTSCLVM